MAEYQYPLAACKYCPLLGRPSFNDQVSTLEAEIERLRAALRWYAEEGYNGYNGGPDAARKALEGKDE